jgi:uncharacterized damage-inducible protein DinB
MERTDPDQVGDEITQLTQFLEFNRGTVVTKAEGLDHAGLNATHAPSEMTIAGIVKHLALVEDWWFHQIMGGRDEPEPWASAPEDDPDWEWHSAGEDSLEELLTQYAESCARSRAVVASFGGDLDATSVRRSRRTGEHFTLRWIFLHMLEETARHAGHADLLREAIDGATGE